MATKTQYDSEQQLWRDVTRGDTQAFEQLVSKYQSAVSAVAFSIVGDFSSSQDIAQETFWAAWKTRDKLRDSSRLGGWLCGIARNMARQWRRHKNRRDEISHSQSGFEPQSSFDDPVDQFISQEEESLVWKTLEKIPQNYREVLTLYYRQGQSIDEVAKSLGLSNAAARQRLSRGREMLRGRISQLIEGVLDRSNPSRTFTTRVMAGISAAGVVSQSATASASMGTVAKSSVAVATAKGLAGGSMAGLAGGLLGAFGGLGGAWLGSWVPAQLAPTETERQLLMERARAVLRVGVVYAICVLVLTLGMVWGHVQWLVFALGMFAITMALVGWGSLHAVRTQALVARLRKELSPEEDPNLSKFAKKFQGTSKRGRQVFRGRRFTSSMTLFGLPILDVQVSDPIQSQAAKPDRSNVRVARGWIAIGDTAKGVLVAIGGRAMGLLAIGGASCGVVSVGGVSVGLFSLGGLALGALAFGGAAIGYDACGGAAMGWHSAAGGGALAYHVAAGGGALASEYAIGGAALAAEVNTDLAQEIAESESYFSLLSKQWLITLVVVASVVIPTCSLPVFYTREFNQDELTSKG